VRTLEPIDTDPEPGAWSCAFTVALADGTRLPMALPIADRVVSLRWPRAEITVLDDMDQILVQHLDAPPEVGVQRTVASAIQAEIRRSSASVPWVGVATGPAGSGSIQEESRAAVARARQLSPDPRVVLFDDLLAVLALASDHEATARLASLLEPILRHDERSNAQLMTALSTYIESDLSAATAAGRLGVHRHTLDQRLRTVEQLLGRSIKRYPDRFLIESALVAQRIVRGT
jgi:sugar diacid utilization regulator